jgi:hypothetical protein
VRVILQAGHHPGAGGAPGEAGWTIDLAGRIAGHLRRRDVEVAIVGAWNPHDESTAPAEVRRDADIFVSLHYDAAVYGAGKNTGCFADRAKNETRPVQADDLIKKWESLYSAATGIALANGRRNSNTCFYYAFRALTNPTPGVILEHGVGAPHATGGFPAGDDAALLHSEHGKQKIALADANAILRFLGLQPVIEDAAELARLHELRAALDEANAIKAEFELVLRNEEGDGLLPAGKTDELIAKGRTGLPTLGRSPSTLKLFESALLEANAIKAEFELVLRDQEQTGTYPRSVRAVDALIAKGRGVAGAESAPG